MSLNLIVPLLELYMNRLQCCGWNSAAVMTSVSSSIFVGLISTMSTQRISSKKLQTNHSILKLWFEISIFHRLIRKSSADRYVSPSEFGDIELMWYACANQRKSEKIILREAYHVHTPFLVQQRPPCHDGKAWEPEVWGQQVFPRQLAVIFRKSSIIWWFCLNRASRLV